MKLSFPKKLKLPLSFSGVYAVDFPAYLILLVLSLSTFLFFFDAPVAFAAEIDPEDIINETQKEYKFYKDWKFWATTTIAICIAIFFFRGGPSTPPPPPPSGIQEIVKPVTDITPVVEVIKDVTETIPAAEVTNNVTPVIEVAQTSTEVVTAAVVTAVTTAAAIAVQTPEISEVACNFMVESSLFDNYFFVRPYISFLEILQKIDLVYNFFQHEFPESHKLYNYQMRTRSHWLYLLTEIANNDIISRSKFINYTSRVSKNPAHFEQINTFLLDAVKSEAKIFLSYTSELITNIINGLKFPDFQVIQDEYSTRWKDPLNRRYDLLLSNLSSKDEYPAFWSKVIMLEHYIYLFNGFLHLMHAMLADIVNPTSKIAILYIIKNIVDSLFQRIKKPEKDLIITDRITDYYIELEDHGLESSKPESYETFLQSVGDISSVVDGINKENLIVEEESDLEDESEGQTSTEVVTAAVVTAVTTAAAIAVQTPEILEQSLAVLKAHSNFDHFFFVSIYLKFADILLYTSSIHNFFQHPLPQSHELYIYQSFTREYWLFILDVIRSNDISSRIKFVEYNTKTIMGSAYFEQINTFIKESFLNRALPDFFLRIYEFIENIFNTNVIPALEVVLNDCFKPWHAMLADVYLDLLLSKPRPNSEIFWSISFTAEWYIGLFCRCLDKMYTTFEFVHNNLANNTRVLSLLKDVILNTELKFEEPHRSINYDNKLKRAYDGLKFYMVKSNSEKFIPFNEALSLINDVIKGIERNDVLVKGKR